MKKIRISFILLAVMIIFAGGMFFTSCEKENTLENNTNNEEVQTKKASHIQEDYLYNTTKTMSSKAGTFIVEYVIHTDYKENLNADLIFEPVYKTASKNTELTNLFIEENVIEEEYEKADISIELVNVSLPDGAVGVSLSFDEDVNTKGNSGIREMFAYHSQGWHEGYVEFLEDQSGKSWIKAKIGVLWKPKSWFYDYTRTKMKYETEEFLRRYNNFYKIHVRAKYKNAKILLEINK